jgi:tripartite-type tricarboxylate transporter receptor subunit TctC
MTSNGLAPLNSRGADFTAFVKESVEEIQGISKEIGLIK